MESSEPVNILLVDDREEGLITLESVLRSPDYNLVMARSGKEALARLLERDFAVILLDVQMPDMDGFETASFIKQREKSKNIPIIFVTAINKDERYVVHGYETGAVDYIFKPLDPQILCSKVAVFVDLFRKNQQVRYQAQMLWEAQQQEQARQLAQLELESLNRYRNLADAIPHIIWKTKPDGTVDYFNQTWLRYSGLSFDQSSGDGWKQVFHGDDVKCLLATWKQARKTETEFELECRIRCAHDEIYRWHLVKVVPEFSKEGLLSSWLLSSTEIHQRKEAEEKLIQAKEVADTANRAKSFFLANMSHEIRTPLGAIMGFAELMADPNQGDEDRMACAATIQRNGHQLLKIIDEILDISKVEADRLILEKVELDLVELIEELQSSLRLQVEKKGLELCFVLESPVPKVIFSDPTRVRQILMNIIGNAVKFSDQGTICVKVGLAQNKVSHSPQVQFVIEDHGPGIDGKYVGALFQPFSQGDDSTTRRFGGTGLGLALSRKLARALGGDVVLTSSQLGAGSTFTVTLGTGCDTIGQTVDSLDPAPRRCENLSTVDQSERHSLRGVRVLLAEDGVDNQKLLIRLLTNAGAEVQVAQNGAEAIAKALSGQFEIVLMDIQMPEVDGYQATQELRRRGYSRPIVALTAHALKEEREKCLRSGCNDHLAKPVDRSLLYATIAQHARKLGLQPPSRALS